MGEVDIWIVSGSMKPSFENKEGFASGVDGFLICMNIGEELYHIPITREKLKEYKITDR